MAQQAGTAPAAVLTSADMRGGRSLDGAWHWSIDPYRDGVAGFHGDPAGPSSRRWADIVQADVARQDPTALFEFDMQRSPIVHLPGSWIGHAPEMRLYHGLVWYQRTFEAAPTPSGKRAFLRFGAAHYKLTNRTHLRNAKLTELTQNPDGTIRTIDPFVR
ncbi:MAG: hypothetical protein M3Q08_16100 [Pseudomonadota bacterium]|nr:hypothetical protein [Pseudomonadota bacterium]